MKLVFDHVGITTHEPKPDENWIEQSLCWVTSPRDHPESIEFLRYHPDSKVPDRVKNNPHVAFRVEDLAPHIAGQEISYRPSWSPASSRRCSSGNTTRSSNTCAT